MKVFLVVEIEFIVIVLLISNEIRSSNIVGFHRDLIVCIIDKVRIISVIDIANLHSNFERGIVILNIFIRTHVFQFVVESIFVFDAYLSHIIVIHLIIHFVNGSGVGGGGSLGGD